MIGYRISRAQIEKEIEAAAPGWLSRAKQRIAEFRAQGRYAESSSIWSEVKPVYMKLQGGSKCAFCERKLESVEYGKGEQAVEHFRPKGNIAVWKLPAALAAEGVTVTPPPSKQGGYYLLAYDLFNYSAACNPCNSALKKDFFPIAGKHQLKGSSPEALLIEEPLLIYPVGDLDERPEKLIRFHGISPQAVAPSGHKRNRALVTIEFFKLDEPVERGNLLRERARAIVMLFPQLRTLAGPAAAEAQSRAREIVAALTSPRSEHCNCARSFCSLFERDQTEAESVSDAAFQFFVSKS